MRSPDSRRSASRRKFLQAALTTGGSAALYPALGAGRVLAATAAPEVKPFELEEITVPELQDGMKSGKFTARSLVEKYLARIDEVDTPYKDKRGPAINAIIELNPDAMSIADALDDERKAKGPRGPLHGILVLIKDNIDTTDKMMTTAGSLALVGSKPPKDSFVAQKLRASGAVILGKTNLSEWANMRSSHSVSGWSGRGGLTKNPYALDRNACGSSSGTGAGISANLAAVGIGTETDGSIVCPSSANGLAGIKPTVGLVSRSGIIPISHSQDGAGPMCRTVRDAAILLGALTGVDPEDAATAASAGKSQTDYARFCDPNGLKGARIGVARKYFGFSEPVDALMEQSLAVMKQKGAVLVDPADIETFGKFDDSELIVLLYELKADLNAYLARLGPSAPVTAAACSSSIMARSGSPTPPPPPPPISWSMTAAPPAPSPSRPTTISSLFISHRSEANEPSHSFLALYDLSTRTLRFLSPSTSDDSAPSFSPDGTHIAWLRSPFLGPREFAAARTSPTPWSIQIADLAAGISARGTAAPSSPPLPISPAASSPASPKEHRASSSPPTPRSSSTARPTAGPTSTRSTPAATPASSG